MSKKMLKKLKIKFSVKVGVDMRRFKQYTIEEFEKWLITLNLQRNIKEIHVHHTWRPTKEGYMKVKDKEKVIWSMWKYHTTTRKWQDIGQHFTVSPDGLIWDGRSLELAPASIKGRNSGAIAIEMIGDFDIGRERLEGKQLYSITRAVFLMLKKFNLSYEDIVFHREYSNKTCPGSSIDKDWFIELVKRAGDSKEIHWKEQGLYYLNKYGILDDIEGWKKKIDESMPVWAVTILLSKLYKKLKEEK